MIYDVRTEHPQVDAEFENKQSKALRALREHEAGVADHPALKAAVNQWLADHGGSLVGDVVRRVRSGLDSGDYDGGIYDHVIVDEFQDLTEAEADILVQLCAGDGQLVALGDRKQSIYAFRGNDQRGLDALPELVSGPVDDMPMDECQRCNTEIVDLANAVMALEGEPLVDVRGPGAQIHQLFFPTPDDEIAGMAEELVRVYNERPDDEHLVLVTRRKWGYDLRNAIRIVDDEAPVETAFAEDVLETWPVREAFMLLTFLGSPDPVALRDWIGYRKSTDGKKFKAPRRNAGCYLPLKEAFGVLTVKLVDKLKDRPVSAFHGTGKGNVLYRLERLRELLKQAPSVEDPNAVIQHVLDPIDGSTSPARMPTLRGTTSKGSESKQKRCSPK